MVDLNFPDGRGPCSSPVSLVRPAQWHEGTSLGQSKCTPLVLLDEVQVVTPHDERPVHLGRLDGAGQDAATDRHIAGERALVVDVRACKTLQPEMRGGVS
jgi:hypothetical protein